MAVRNRCAVRVSELRSAVRMSLPVATALLLAGCGIVGGNDTGEGGDDPTEENSSSGGLSPEEYESAYSACIEEAGWQLSRDEFGQLSIELPAEQDEDYERAANACADKFELDAKYSEPLDDEQLELIYTHYQQDAIPCLESLGYAPAALPSLDVFIATLTSPDAYQIISQDVYGSIIDDVKTGRWETPDDVIGGQCEMSPPDEVLYP